MEPLKGDCFFVTAPHVNTLYFEYLLTAFSGHEPEVFKVIFLDRAGYHKAGELRVPENVRLVFLPSSNPELNPVERLWEDMKGKVAFNNFRDEEESEQWIESTAKAYSSQQIASLTGYSYIKMAVDQAKKAME